MFDFHILLLLLWEWLTLFPKWAALSQIAHLAMPAPPSDNLSPSNTDRPATTTILSKIIFDCKHYFAWSSEIIFLRDPRKTFCAILRWHLTVLRSFLPSRKHPCDSVRGSDCRSRDPASWKGSCMKNRRQKSRLPEIILILAVFLIMFILFSANQEELLQNIQYGISGLEAGAIELETPPTPWFSWNFRQW